MQVGVFEDGDVDIETWVAQRIAAEGYAQISIHDPASGLPGYAFTLGLEQSRRTPELFCMGVAPDIASQLFSLCIGAQDAVELDLARGNQDVQSLVEGFTLRFRRVAPAMVQKANLVCPESCAPITDMVQLLMPDNDGHFPGDLACDPQVAAAQDLDWLLVDTPN